MAEWENWFMWQERCSADLCTAEAQHDLSGFAFSRFQRYLQKLRPAFAPPSASDAWHAFETHLALGRTRTLKGWKSWLFARGGENPSLGCIQGGATLIMRDVVRTYVRQEHSPPWMLSLDAPLDRSADQQSCAVALEDLLPNMDDPLAAVDEHELTGLVDRLLSKAIEMLSDREKMVLTLHHNGKTLSHPAVTSAAQCGKSSLCNALHQSIEKMAHLLQDMLPEESGATRLQIARMLIAKIATATEKELEMTHPDLFRYIKEE